MRRPPAGKDDCVFPDAPRCPDDFFPKAVRSAQTALAGAGKDTGQLHAYTWHANRHTWAFRLTMAGVDPRTIMALGGWSSGGMLARYSHLTPGHLQGGREAGRARIPGRHSHQTNVGTWVAPSTQPNFISRNANS